MSEPTKTAPATFKFNEQEFLALLEKQENYLKDFVGKRNHNPFLKANELIKMRDAFNDGDRSETLFNAAKALKQTPPIIDPNLAEPIEDLKQTATPIGLKLPNK